MMEQRYDLCTPYYSQISMLWIIEDTYSTASEILTAEKFADLFAGCYSLRGLLESV